MAVNNLTGISPFEMGFVHNLVTFSVAGAVFGVVAGGFLSLFEGMLPFRRVFLKAPIVSVSIWLVLRGTGVALSGMRPLRYHISNPESLQGLALAVVLGLILGALWKREDPEVAG